MVVLPCVVVRYIKVQTDIITFYKTLQISSKLNDQCSTHRQLYWFRCLFKSRVIQSQRWGNSGFTAHTIQSVFSSSSVPLPVPALPLLPPHLQVLHRCEGCRCWFLSIRRFYSTWLKKFQRVPLITNLWGCFQSTWQCGHREFGSCAFIRLKRINWGCLKREQPSRTSFYFFEYMTTSWPLASYLRVSTAC